PDGWWSGRFFWESPLDPPGFRIPTLSQATEIDLGVGPGDPKGKRAGPIPRLLFRGHGRPAFGTSVLGRITPRESKPYSGGSCRDAMVRIRLARRSTVRASGLDGRRLRSVALFAGLGLDSDPSPLDRFRRAPGLDPGLDRDLD